MKKIIKLAIILTIGITGNASCSIKQPERKSPLLESLETLDIRTVEIENNIYKTEETNKIPHSRFYMKNRLMLIHGQLRFLRDAIVFAYTDSQTDDIDDTFDTINLWLLKRVITNYKKKKPPLTNQEKKLLKKMQNRLRNIFDNFTESDEEWYLAKYKENERYRAIVYKFLDLPEYKEEAGYVYTIRSINRWIKSWLK